MSNTKIVAWDLDDVLCVRSKDLEYLGIEKYTHCTPKNENINICNEMWLDGWYVIIYTARGMNYFKGDISLIYTKLYSLTEKQLQSWGILYDELIMGKIHYDLIIDDKAGKVKNGRIDYW